MGAARSKESRRSAGVTSAPWQRPGHAGGRWRPCMGRLAAPRTCWRAVASLYGTHVAHVAARWCSWSGLQALRDVSGCRDVSSRPALVLWHALRRSLRRTTSTLRGVPRGTVPNRSLGGGRGLGAQPIAYGRAWRFAGGWRWGAWRSPRQAAMRRQMTACRAEPRVKALGGGAPERQAQRLEVRTRSRCIRPCAEKRSERVSLQVRTNEQARLSRSAVASLNAPPGPHQLFYGQQRWRAVARWAC